MSLYDSWIIVKGVEKEALWDTLGLEEVSKPPGRSLFGYSELPGWSVVWTHSDAFDGRSMLYKASELDFALRLHLQDVEKFKSILTAAQNGEALWQVSTKDGNLRLVGKPPYQRNSLKELVRGFDGMFGDENDIPSALAKAVCGFEIGAALDERKYLVPKKGSPLAGPPRGFVIRGLLKLWDACDSLMHRFGFPAMAFLGLLFMLLLQLMMIGVMQLFKWLSGAM